MTLFVKAMTEAVLYGYWLSSCSWRVRAALHLKKISFEEKSIDIVKDRKQLEDAYRSINPSQKVPALKIDGVTLVESMAILQYIDETRPAPGLMPAAALPRAHVRAICETIVSGIQPLQNFGLKLHLDSEQQFNNFTKHWTVRGLKTLEDLLSKTASKYCVGDQLTMADICLVPQCYNAVTRHKLNLNEFPTVSKLYTTLLEEKTFSATHPENIRRKTSM